MIFIQTLSKLLVLFSAIFGSLLSAWQCLYCSSWQMLVESRQTYDSVKALKDARGDVFWAMEAEVLDK